MDERLAGEIDLEPAASAFDAAFAARATAAAALALILLGDNFLPFFPAANATRAALSAGAKLAKLAGATAAETVARRNEAASGPAEEGSAWERAAATAVESKEGEDL